MGLGDDFWDPEPSSSDGRSVFARIPVGSRITSFIWGFVWWILRRKNSDVINWAYIYKWWISGMAMFAWPCGGCADTIDWYTYIIYIYNIYIYTYVFHENKLGFGCNSSHCHIFIPASSSSGAVWPPKGWCFSAPGIPSIQHPNWKIQVPFDVFGGDHLLFPNGPDLADKHPFPGNSLWPFWDG